MAFAVVFIGCGDDRTSNPTAQAPDLPPQSTFVMPFDGFVEQSAAQIPSGESLAAMTKLNWGQSAVRIGVWNLLIGVGLAVPVASFIEAFNHDPVQLEDGSWQWSYSVTIDGAQPQEYTCRLVGNTVDNEVHWSMYLSQTGVFDDYLWYTGTNNLPSTEGTWTVNRGPDYGVPFLQIDWHRNVESQTGDLKYTNVIPDDAENGGYIFYGSNTDAAYDRFYNIYNKGQENLTRIEWNFANKNGRVKDEHFYLNIDWHCWDSNLDDVDCP